jgi:catechol 2,3-dioxygenase-like lactoylglutathione lyase family enzyme
VTRFREAFPIVYADDVARSAAFYVDNLGFEEVHRFPPEGEADFIFLKLDPLGIALSKRTPANEGREFELCIYADDVDAAAEQLRAAGAEEVQAPQDMEWGERLTYFRSPGGTLLHVTAKVA